MDLDGDMEINFKEFCNFMAPLFYRTYTRAEIKAAFRQFDKDKSGFITAREFQEVLNKMGRKSTFEEVNNMIKSIDRDGDGKISIEDFAQLLD